MGAIDIHKATNLLHLVSQHYYNYCLVVFPIWTTDTLSLSFLLEYGAIQ